MVICTVCSVYWNSGLQYYIMCVLMVCAWVCLVFNSMLHQFLNSPETEAQIQSQVEKVCLWLTDHQTAPHTSTPCGFIHTHICVCVRERRKSVFWFLPCSSSPRRPYFPLRGQRGNLGSMSPSPPIPHRLHVCYIRPVNCNTCIRAFTTQCSTC